MRFTILLAAVFAVSLTAVSHAQETRPFVRAETPVNHNAIKLYEGMAPGSEDADMSEIWTNVGTERWVRNVTTPTLEPFLPDEDKATGAAVIVVPGGGFQFVSIDNEGYPVAKWLAEQGIAAFLLKYRIMETPEDEAEFAAHIGRLFSPDPNVERVDVTKGIPFAVADAQAALSMVEARSEKWGIDKDRIGMLGFSAGAMTTLGVVLSDGETPQPDFIGYIYGPMRAVETTEDLPPMFNAMSSDDPLFGGQGFGLIETWKKAGAPVELHYYETGGHGFGSYKRGVSADAWFDQYMLWMRSRGLLDKTE